MVLFTVQRNRVLYTSSKFFLDGVAVGEAGFETIEEICHCVLGPLGTHKHTIPGSRLLDGGGPQPRTSNTTAGLGPAGTGATKARLQRNAVHPIGAAGVRGAGSPTGMCGPRGRRRCTDAVHHQVHLLWCFGRGPRRRVTASPAKAATMQINSQPKPRAKAPQNAPHRRAPANKIPPLCRTSRAAATRCPRPNEAPIKTEPQANSGERIIVSPRLHGRRSHEQQGCPACVA